MFHGITIKKIEPPENEMKIINDKMVNISLTDETHLIIMSTGFVIEEDPFEFGSFQQKILNVSWLMEENLPSQFTHLKNVPDSLSEIYSHYNLETEPNIIKEIEICNKKIILLCYISNTFAYCPKQTIKNLSWKHNYYTYSKDDNPKTFQDILGSILKNKLYYYTIEDTKVPHNLILKCIM